MIVGEKMERTTKEKKKVTCKCGHDKFHHYKEQKGPYAECLALLGDGQDMDFCPCGKYEEGEVVKHTLYILNTPILTEYGKYDFRRADIPEVQVLLAQGNFTSAIGHDATATLMTQLTGVQIPVNRIAIKMQSGDTAVVFRVLTRLPEGKILSEEELTKVPCEFGILERKL